MMIRTLSSLAFLAALGACASTAPSAGGAPAPARRPAERKLPVSAFIDSAALHQALLAAPPAPAGFRLKPLYVVLYDSTGALQNVRPMFERELPGEYGRRMVELLRSNVRPRITATKPSANIVWLQSGSSPRIAVEEQLVEVRPRLVNTAEITRELERVSQRLQRLDPSLAGQQRTAEVSMRVSVEGVPEQLTIRRSTGASQIDREIVNAASMMRYAPATINEYPVSVLVQIPITVVFSQQRPPVIGTPQP